MDPVIVERARRIAEQYRIVLEPEDDPKYVGHPLELPGCMGGGDTPDECVADVLEAATSLIGYMLEEGRVPPEPAHEAKRTEQINIRVTEEEKLRIEAAARRDGFRGVSDFLRAAALASTMDRGR